VISDFSTDFHLPNLATTTLRRLLYTQVIDPLSDDAKEIILL